MSQATGTVPEDTAPHAQPAAPVDSLEGHCLCGAVAYRGEGAPLWVAHCHCESCRRACSAPFTTFLAFPHGKWEWTRAVPIRHRSSAGARRHFCATCGSQIAYESDDTPGEMHFYAASLADPASVTPTRHDFAGERVPWVHLADGLPEDEPG